MTLALDIDRLRRMLSASLPAGASVAELFVESRIGVSVEIALDEPGGTPRLSAQRRHETGAHLRRFSEGRHESFVLDAPRPETLEALALHPEALEVEWLTGTPRLGVAPDRSLRPGIEARLSDAVPSEASGPWSAPFLAAARALLDGWLCELDRAAAGASLRASGAARLEAHIQEILVLATDRDPARDTRSFVDATLRADLSLVGRIWSSEETRSAPSLASLSAASASGPPTALVERGRRGFEAGPAPRGEMPVVFASTSGGFLLHEVCGHLLEADHVVRGGSPFAGARGTAIASPLLTLADDGSIPGMRGSALFDDEGTAARRTPLIMQGTLVGYLSDRLTAFATDGICSGNGRRQTYRDSPMPRATNLVIDPGVESSEEILGGTRAGLLVTRLGRGRVDPATGRFALAVEEGWLVRDGRVAGPIAGAILRGRASDLLPGIDAVGADATSDDGAPRCIKEGQALPFGVLQPTIRVASIGVTGGDR